MTNNQRKIALNFVQKAVTSYSEKQLKRQARSRRKNQRPEFEVKKAVLAWLRDNQFSCDAVESKAVFNAQAGRYLAGQTTPGVSDLFGCTPDGRGCFIELKAPGRRSTLKDHQRDFLRRKIEVGAFAVCVDSVEYLKSIWEEFQLAQKMEPRFAKALLLRHLNQGR